jgi:hypothetical protein
MPAATGAHGDAEVLLDVLDCCGGWRRNEVRELTRAEVGLKSVIRVVGSTDGPAHARFRRPAPGSLRVRRSLGPEGATSRGRWEFRLNYFEAFPSSVAVRSGSTDSVAVNPVVVPVTV